MSEPTRSGPPSTAAVPTQVAPVINSDNDNGTLEHAHNPRAHACVPAPPPIPGILVEDDQECRVHDPSVPSGPAGRRGLSQQLDKTPKNNRKIIEDAEADVISRNHCNMFATTARDATHGGSRSLLGGACHALERVLAISGTHGVVGGVG